MEIQVLTQFIGGPNDGHYTAWVEDRSYPPKFESLSTDHLDLLLAAYSLAPIYLLVTYTWDGKYYTRKEERKAR